MGIKSFHTSDSPACSSSSNGFSSGFPTSSVASSFAAPPQHANQSCCKNEDFFGFSSSTGFLNFTVNGLRSREILLLALRSVLLAFLLQLLPARQQFHLQLLLLQEIFLQALLLFSLFRNRQANLSSKMTSATISSNPGKRLKRMMPMMRMRKILRTLQKRRLVKRLLLVVLLVFVCLMVVWAVP